jgi:hypothetical protein
MGVLDIPAHGALAFIIRLQACPARTGRLFYFEVPWVFIGIVGDFGGLVNAGG